MSTRNKSSSELTPIGTILGKLLKTYRSDASGSLNKILACWNAAVGDAVAQNAQPAAIKDQHLIVHVSSSPWIQELQFLKQDLILKLNQILNEERIQTITFKIGPL